MNFKKSIISLICTASLVISSSISFAYNDIGGHWAEGYINDMKSKHILGQFEDSGIQPDKPINRAEAIKMISQASQLPYDRHLNLSDGGTRPEYENSYYHIDKIDTSSSEKPYDPYEWEPGVKEKFEETVVRLGYAKPGDTFDYVKFGVYNSQGHYVVYKNGDYSHQFLGVNCKTGDFHG